MSLNLSLLTRRQLPVMLLAECGLACISMIASYWGHRIDLPSMRQRFTISIRGATLKSLITMAQGVSLHARPLKLDLKGIERLKLPCILHWDLNHFVVAKAASHRGLVIIDPAVGERRIPMSEVSKRFSGIALELSPGPDFRANKGPQSLPLRALMGRVIGLRVGLLQLLTLGLVLQAIYLITPFYLQWVVDEAIVAADRGLIATLGIGFLLLTAMQCAVMTARSWVGTTLTSNLKFQWLGNAFSHLLRLPLPYFEKRSASDIVARFGSIQHLQQCLTTQFVETCIDGLLAISVFAAMLMYSTTLTTVAAAAVALYSGLRWAVYSRLRGATADQIVLAAKQQAHLLESARGVRSIRLFGRAEERRISWMNALADQLNAELRVSKISISFQVGNSLIFGIERVVVIWLAAMATIESRFSIGMLLAYLSYKDHFSQRAASLIDKLFELRMMRLHGERVADIVLAPREEDGERSPAAHSPDPIAGDIDVRNLSFRYSDSDPLLLNSINLKISAGEFVAITGVSGSGKTTLIKLLLGLLKPLSGEILIDGKPLREHGHENFRRAIGTVMQDDHLFSGSIADNICFFDMDCDMEAVQASAKAAAIHDEISRMPMGYRTLVGDIDSGLSGGQKQRILMARALYRKPRIVFLDEATSHLDIWNEEMVNTALGRLSPTRIVIAHRPETIAAAQRILILDQGKIVQDSRASERISASLQTPQL